MTVSAPGRPEIAPSADGTPTASITPTIRTTARRAVYWGVALVIALIIVAIVYSTMAQRSQPKPLDPAGATPIGSKAVVEVLRQSGVTVTAAESRRAAQSALDKAGGDTTLFVYDQTGILDTEDLVDLAASADSLVLVLPDFMTLQELAPGVLAGGFENDDAAAVESNCDIQAAERAEETAPSGTFRIDPDSDATGCFPVDDDRFAMVHLETDGQTVTILGNPMVFTNDRITESGNAALALNVLGSAENLVWYLPGVDDLKVTGPPSLAELTPDWAVPVTSLLAIAAIVAMFWRGRRFGPIVVENLPVTVKAGETMEGRARLYARSSSRLRALDALRIGTVERLAVMLGLARTAAVVEVADATASATGLHPASVRQILLEAAPQTDADLIRLSDALTDLEKRTRHATDETGRITR